eukprot:6189894-Pleurochrysis_carterae.AAC.1
MGKRVTGGGGEMGNILQAVFLQNQQQLVGPNAIRALQSDVVKSNGAKSQRCSSMGRKLSIEYGQGM